MGVGEGRENAAGEVSRPEGMPHHCPVLPTVSPGHMQHGTQCKEVRVILSSPPSHTRTISCSVIWSVRLALCEHASVHFQWSKAPCPHNNMVTSVPCALFACCKAEPSSHLPRFWAKWTREMNLQTATVRYNSKLCLKSRLLFYFVPCFTPFPILETAKELI